jgi:hypothetical protein
MSGAGIPRWRDRQIGADQVAALVQVSGVPSSHRNRAEAKERIGQLRAANVRRSKNEEEQPEVAQALSLALLGGDPAMRRDSHRLMRRREAWPII